MVAGAGPDGVAAAGASAGAALGPTAAAASAEEVALDVGIVDAVKGSVDGTAKAPC